MTLSKEVNFSACSNAFGNIVSPSARNADTFWWLRGNVDEPGGILVWLFRVLRRELRKSLHDVFFWKLSKTWVIRSSSTSSTFSTDGQNCFIWWVVGLHWHPVLKKIAYPTWHRTTISYILILWWNNLILVRRRQKEKSYGRFSVTSVIIPYTGKNNIWKRQFVQVLLINSILNQLPRRVYTNPLR